MWKKNVVVALAIGMLVGTFASQVEVSTGRPPVTQAHALPVSPFPSTGVVIRSRCNACGVDKCNRTASGYLECSVTCTGEDCKCTIGPTECDEPAQTSLW